MKEMDQVIQVCTKWHIFYKFDQGNADRYIRVKLNGRNESHLIQYMRPGHPI